MLRVVPVGHVAGVGHRLATGLVDRGDGPRRLVGVEVVDDDAPAGRRDLQGFGPPQAPSGAGDLRSAFAVICRAAPSAGGGLLLITSMWSAMVLAMMLPSAGPMIFTYAEIADTAARKNERIVSPLVLAGGYAAVWLGFAAAAALAQLALTRVAWLDGGMPSASGPFSGALLLAAGLYQFSAFKDACLTQCQRPFPFFFAHWQTTARGVFRLGLQQGLYCLGCCWAMMLLMFATGAMNVLWMAALGITMTLEKMLTGRRLSTALGAIMVTAGLFMMGAAVAAHWLPPAD
jgi:predicted metal-binding membrane protein